MKPIAVNSNDFPSIIRDEQIYVDKTAYFHALVTDRQHKYFFLARPRRFGKTLMVSTLKAIFEGRRELFAGLAIDATDYGWKRCPVLAFNFGQVDASTFDAFDRSFPSCVRSFLEKAGYDNYIPEKSASWNFGRAIDTLAAKSEAGQVAVLVDEYDDPVARSLKDIAQAKAVRDQLGDFYAQLKDRTDAVRFLMITGVSKFTKLSVFSTLSNMTDITFDDRYATMLGYTDDELDVYFCEQMRVQADLMGLDWGEYRRSLKWWYNGFRFTRKNPATLYNPISISMTLAEPEDQFRATWTETGRPSMLMNYMEREEFLSLDTENVKNVTDDVFDVFDIDRINAKGLLFQTGYLTIKDYDRETGEYSLHVPDEEIRRDINKLVASVAANEPATWVSYLGSNLIHAEWPSFFNGLKALYAGLCYGSTETSVHESPYARGLVILLRAQGIGILQEVQSADGRADVVAEHKLGVFIFELKKDGTTDDAFAQIEKKGYAKPHLASGKPVWTVALVFDGETRQLKDCEARRAADAASL